ncbi:hypothetical protein CVT25_013179, partial [Psilocybe cyanescens]
VSSAAFSNDGTCIVSCSSDKSVRVWDASTGAELKVLNGHTDSVWSAAFSSDSTRIVSCSSDKSVRVWDVSTGAELKVLNGHTDSVRSAAFSVTSSTDSSCTILHEDSARLSIVDSAYPAWTTISKPWIISALGRYRLMWVPEMAYPYTIIVISRKGSAHINFQDCKIGRDWAECYTSSPLSDICTLPDIHSP